MKKNIHIAVPNPCHEKWSSFTKTSNGGFCTSCQKEVIDFTSWGDERIKRYFKNATGSTCGRFQSQQLKVYTYDSPRSGRFGWGSVLFAGLLVLLTSRQVTAQRDSSKHPTEQFHEESKIGKTTLTVSSVVKVSGVVKSTQDGNVMPGVTVLLKGTERGTVTDIDGRFEIALEDLPPSPVLVFSFIGFGTIEYPVDVTRSEQEATIEMFPQVTSLGGIVVGGAITCKWYSPRTWWWKVRGLFW